MIVNLLRIISTYITTYSYSYNSHNLECVCHILWFWYISISRCEEETHLAASCRTSCCKTRERTVSNNSQYLCCFPGCWICLTLPANIFLHHLARWLCLCSDWRGWLSMSFIPGNIWGDHCCIKQLLWDNLNRNFLRQFPGTV